MTRLEQLENQSIFIIREAFHKFNRMALLWSMGKDSTTMLWLCYKAFLGKIPFPVVHIDTGYKFKEMYEFRDQWAKKWNLELVVVKNEQAIQAGMGPEAGSKLDCCHALKTEALQSVIGDLKLDAVLAGIRRDEHGIRAKERYFSPRDQNFQWDYKNQPMELWSQFETSVEKGSHYRIHPLLHMDETDIWRYVASEELPTPSLYFSRNGYRYRSIGCRPCCRPVKSEAMTTQEIIEEISSSATSERAGRAQDKEDETTMQNLRALGYM